MICRALPRLSAIIAKSSQTTAALNSTIEAVVSKASAACSRAIAACLRYLKAFTGCFIRMHGRPPCDGYDRDFCVTIKACHGVRGNRSEAEKSRTLAHQVFALPAPSSRRRVKLIHSRGGPVAPYGRIPYFIPSERSVHPLR
jgi:hypothetical protein